MIRAFVCVRHQDMLCAVERGLLSVSRIDEAVRAILQLKVSRLPKTSPTPSSWLTPGGAASRH